MTQEASILSMIGDMKGELGEFRGQLREIVHNLNNLSAKIDGLSNTSARHHDLPEEIAALRLRITALEVAEHQRAGAINLGSLLLRSPMLGWLVGAAVAVWAFVKK